MKKINSLLIVSLLSTGVYANIDVKSLDIYKNRTFINQQLNTNDSSVDLIGKVRFEDIRFLNNGECKVSNISIISNNYSSDTISSKIQEYKQKIAFKTNEITSVKNVIQNLSSIKFEKDAVNLKNIKEVSTYTQKEVEANYNLVYKLQLELRKYNKELNELTNKKNSNVYSKLNYNATCKNGSNLVVSYPTFNISKNSFYEINTSSKDKKVEIKNKSFITQSSGYDFKNININMYTYNYTNAVNPQIFRPQYLDIVSPGIMKKTYAQADAVMEMSAPAMMKSSRVAPSFSYNETTTKAFFKASHIDLLSGIKNAVTFSNDSYKAKNEIEIDGYSSSNAFYKVDFKSDKLYSTQNTKLYLDGTFIGQSYIGEIKKDKKTSLYLGIDSFIDVKKDLIKDMKEKPFFSMSKLKTEKLWKYTITNNSKEEKTITLLERLPVSKHEDIKVTLIPNTNYTKKEDNGKISYDITLKPSEEKIIDFGYIVEKPYKK
ncbi:MAG: hypothetical protein CL624_12075 [Arcobacter sp.]|nr:hypothetical protein [Arcobacter sp.]|tara:strand:+ start:1260 stop:2723 length:1464 start_codon:yes stop_codon:yes gene_type:complete